MMLLNGTYTGDRLMQYAWPVPPVVTFAKVEGTKYWKFHETMAVARGPRGYRVPMEDFIYSVWIVYKYGSYLAIERYDGEKWVDYHIITPILEGEVKHVSLTFDSTGNPVCVYEMDGVIYIRWYDAITQLVVIDTIGPGKSPFVSLEFFNSAMGTSQVQMVYIKPDGTVVARFQDDRYIAEYEAITDTVDDILSYGVTGFSNLKMVYTKKVNEVQTILNKATLRKGFWVGDAVEDATKITDIEVAFIDTARITEEEAVSVSVVADAVNVDYRNVIIRPDDIPFDPYDPSYLASIARVAVSLSGTATVDYKDIAVKKSIGEAITSSRQEVVDTFIANIRTSGLPFSFEELPVSNREELVTLFNITVA